MISGFPRGGTTLLQAMCETCVEDARVFGEEVDARVAAKYALRNHRFMVTKRPDDLFFFDEIRGIYAKRPADVRFILLKRDPRAVLTSRHKKGSGDHYVSIGRWRAFYEHWQYQCSNPDVCVVAFEDLVTSTDEVQMRLQEHTEWQVKRPFAEFHRSMDDSFDAAALNGVRPVDASAITRWQSPKHKPYLRELLRKDLKELPQVLIDMGYENSTEWTAEYV